METEAFLDTHLLIWLYAGELDRISEKAKKLLERASLLASPISQLEIDYLFQIKKIRVPGATIFRDLGEKLGLQAADDSFLSVIQEAHNLHWTRDPFDRILVAQARIHKASLITKDRILKKHYSRCVW